MPKYFYHCSNCNKQFELVHSMNDKVEKCPLCDSLNSIKKIYTNVDYSVISSQGKVAGKIVDSFIKEAKEDFKEQIEELKGKELKR